MHKTLAKSSEIHYTIKADIFQVFFSFPNERNKLQVHHLAYRDANPWSYDPDELVVLCEECHKKRHGLISDPTPVEEPKAPETDNYTRSYSSDYNTSERDVRPTTRRYSVRRTAGWQESRTWTKRKCCKSANTRQTK